MNYRYKLALLGMAFTVDQIDALKSAIAEGVLKVKYADKEVEYRSLNDMVRTLKMMEAEVYPQKSSGRKYASFTNGLN